MNRISSLSLLISLSIASSSFGMIENPDDSVIKKNPELMKRVVELTSKGESKLCSGTWIEKGIILTARHCLFLVHRKNPSIRVNGILTNVIQQTSRLSDDLLAKEYQKDIALLLVDDAPLSALQLPESKIGILSPNTTLKEDSTILVAGYGKKAYQPKSKEDEAGTLGAALLKTTQPEKNSPYKMSSSSQRTNIVYTSMAKGSTIEQHVLNGTLKMIFDVISLDKKDRKQSMILNGDSGGPAFIKNENKEWVLAGVASTMQIKPDESEKFEFTLAFGDDQKSGKIKYDSQADENSKIDGEENFLFNSFNRMVQLLKLEFNLNSTDVLPKTVQYFQKNKGKIIGNHAYLGDSENSKTLSDTISAFEKIRDQK